MLGLLHNRHVQAVAGWLGVLTAAFTALGMLTPEWFGELSWPQAIVAAIAAALVTSLVLSIAMLAGAFAFRLIKPISDTPPRPVLTYDPNGVGERLGAVELSLAQLAQKAEAIRVDTAIAGSDIKKLEGKLEKLHERTSLSFIALQHRERLSTLEAEIRQDAADLYDRLKAGEVYDDQAWQQWENVHSHWSRALDEWLESATWYAMKVKERTMTVPDAMYGRKWSVNDEQFPNSDTVTRSEAVRRFKKFRIIHTQWEEVVPSVRDGLKAVAFVGLTDREARRGEPAG